ncbi:MAG: hypothetical protein J5940_00270 [Clostridia bacterium]|nr:hypothetical protein [Clostridia bacterium]
MNEIIENGADAAVKEAGEGGLHPDGNTAAENGGDRSARRAGNADVCDNIPGEVYGKAADAVVDVWRKDAETLKRIYPGFDLESEMKNKKFRHYLLGGDSIRTAYENLHRAEIMEEYGRIAEKNAAARIAGAVAAGARFPRENALSGSASGLTGSGVSHFSKSERADIIRRAANGERIVF